MGLIDLTVLVEGYAGVTEDIKLEFELGVCVVCAERLADGASVSAKIAEEDHP